MSRKKTKGSKKNAQKKVLKNVQEMPQIEEQNSQVSEVSENPKQSPINAKIFYLAAVVILVGVAIYLGVQKYGNQIVVGNVNGKPIFKMRLWQKMEKRYGTQMLDEMINEELIRQEAQKKNIVVSQKDIDKNIKDLETRFKGKEGLNQMLNMQGMTRADLISQISLQLTIEKIVGQAKVSDKEIADEYEKNQSSYGEDLTKEVKEQIKNQLLQQKTSKSFSDWFAKLKKDAKVNKYL